MRRLACRMLLGCLIGVADEVRAEENRGLDQPLRPNGEASWTKGFMDGADHQQDIASRWVTSTASWLDRTFSNLFTPPDARRDSTFDRFLGYRGREVGEQETALRLSPGFSVKEGEGFDPSFRFSARLHLPRFEDRVDLVIANFGQDESVIDEFRAGGFTQSQLEEETDRSISLQARLRETRRLRLSLKTGLNFRPEPVPKVALQLRLEERYGIYTQRLSPSTFWDSRDGFGTNMRLDLERRATAAWRQRLSTFLLWSETSEGLRATETLSIFRNMSRRRTYALHLGATGVVEPSAYITAYAVRVNTHRLIHKNWLFLEVEPGVQFPKERDWKATPFINIQLHIMLGAVR